MKKVIFLLLFFIAAAFGITIEKNRSSIEILPSSQIWITSVHTSLRDARQTHSFVDFHKEHINLGFNAKKAVWVKLELYNSLDTTVTRFIRVDNPLLENIIFFDSGQDYIPDRTGMLNVKENQEFIEPTYKLILLPKEKVTIYVKVTNKTTTLQFGLSLVSQDIAQKHGRIKHFLIIFSVGMLSAFLIYSLTLFVYTKNISYFLYALYLSLLMYQQLTFIGFLPLYAPKGFTYIDNLLVVPKVSFMIIAAALFAKNFLKMQKFPKLNRVYNLFITFLIIQMPILGTQWFYFPEVTVAVGFLFVVFNTLCGVYVYSMGNKQARFFIVGWTFLIIGYLIMIFDSLGLISLMYNFPELILWLTVLEALFLLLAFVDKIRILDTQKKKLDQQILSEIKNRNTLIENEVKVKTEELQVALKDKSTLLKELHHRVKNNLQLILSIARLQRYHVKNDNELEQFIKLEKRVASIAKTHEMLYPNSELAQVDMKRYIEELCDEIKESLGNEKIKIVHDVKTILPVSKAVYVGLIINELITNSIKYAFDENGGIIKIGLYRKDDNCILEISDNGKGYNELEIGSKTLGGRLVRSLVKDQLKGKMEVNSVDQTQYHIYLPLKDNYL